MRNRRDKEQTKIVRYSDVKNNKTIPLRQFLMGLVTDGLSKVTKADVDNIVSQQEGVLNE